MKLLDHRFSESNPIRLALVGSVLVAGLMAVTMRASAVVDHFTTLSYHAEFAEAGGLRRGDDVQIAGHRVGRVEDVHLRGARVVVDFRVDSSIRPGSQSAASIKTLTVLGRKYLAIEDRGETPLEPNETISVDRTTSPFNFTQTLSDLADLANDLDTESIAASLVEISKTFDKTPAGLDAALAGMQSLSASIARRDKSLRAVLARAAEVSTTLESRRESIRKIITDGEVLLKDLAAQRTLISQLYRSLRELTGQLDALVADGRTKLRPALVETRRLLAVVKRNEDQLDLTVRRVTPFARALGEAVGSGPFFLAYVGNLTPEGWPPQGWPPKKGKP